MIVKLLSGHYLELLSFKGDCRGSSESTLVKMSNCWKSQTLAKIFQTMKTQMKCRVLMPQNAAFHQYMHCFLRENRPSENEKQYVSEIIIHVCAHGPSVYTMGHTDLTVLNFIEMSIGLQMVNFHDPSLPFVK